ncbi:MAG: hypothetical protein K2W82_01020, partial [Candidatus Obscuribacterales bacterium]|nr:hypothetical protein [Candidatus Obscuribacterales bacterium]
PVETVKPASPAATTKPVETVKPASPAATTKPVETVKPASPAKTAPADAPSAPAKPVENVKPAAPSKPATVEAPVAPTKPIETVRPASPATPRPKINDVLPDNKPPVIKPTEPVTVLNVVPENKPTVVKPEPVRPTVPDVAPTVPKSPDVVIRPVSPNVRPETPPVINDTPRVPASPTVRPADTIRTPDVTPIPAPAPTAPDVVTLKPATQPKPADLSPAWVVAPAVIPFVMPVSPKTDTTQPAQNPKLQTHVELFNLNPKTETYNLLVNTIRAWQTDEIKGLPPAEFKLLSSKIENALEVARQTILGKAVQDVRSVLESLSNNLHNQIAATKFKTADETQTAVLHANNIVENSTRLSQAGTGVWTDAFETIRTNAKELQALLAETKGAQSHIENAVRQLESALKNLVSANTLIASNPAATVHQEVASQSISLQAIGRSPEFALIKPFISATRKQNEEKGLDLDFPFYARAAAAQVEDARPAAIVQRPISFNIAITEQSKTSHLSFDWRKTRMPIEPVSAQQEIAISAPLLASTRATRSSYHGSSTTSPSIDTYAQALIAKNYAFVVAPLTQVSAVPAQPQAAEASEQRNPDGMSQQNTTASYANSGAANQADPDQQNTVLAAAQTTSSANDEDSIGISTMLDDLDSNSHHV